MCYIKILPRFACYTLRRSTSLLRHLELYLDPRYPADFKEREFVNFATPHQVYRAIRGRSLVRTFTTNTRGPEINKKSLYIHFKKLFMPYTFIVYIVYMYYIILYYIILYIVLYIILYIFSHL